MSTTLPYMERPGSKASSAAGASNVGIRVDLRWKILPKQSWNPSNLVDEGGRVQINQRGRQSCNSSFLQSVSFTGFTVSRSLRSEIRATPPLLEGPHRSRARLRRFRASGQRLEGAGGLPQRPKRTEQSLKRPEAPAETVSSIHHGLSGLEATRISTSRFAGGRPPRPRDATMWGPCGTVQDFFHYLPINQRIGQPIVGSSSSSW